MTGHTIAVGRNSAARQRTSDELLASIDAISGAYMLVTRAFVDEVGVMAEEYFLCMEELYWGQRRGRHKIGFAPGAVIRHVGGVSIGSASDPEKRSRLSVYLASRNCVLFARQWAGWRWPLHFGVGLLYVIGYAFYRSSDTARIALVRPIDEVWSKTGRPDMSAYRPLVSE
jgi:GT2 family glycosyltransferase